VHVIWHCLKSQPDAQVTSSASHFGFKPSVLVGRNISSFVDVFEEAESCGEKAEIMLASMLLRCVSLARLCGR
jgi:hypothetical protein